MAAPPHSLSVRNCDFLCPDRWFPKHRTGAFSAPVYPLKHFKQQYDPEVKRKEESRFKGFNLFNKKEIEKATKHINDKMDEYAEEFYSNKKQKDDDLSL